MSASPSPPARSAPAETPRHGSPGPGSASSLRAGQGQENRERERKMVRIIKVENQATLQDIKYENVKKFARQL